MLRHVELSYDKIPASSSRIEVRELLADFKESPIEVNDIPKAFREGVTRETIHETAEVYLYTYYISLFSFIILYDSQGKTVLKIPTYE